MALHPLSRLDEQGPRTIEALTKLATTTLAIAGIVAIVYVIAFVRPSLGSTETTYAAIGAIAGLGGFSAYRFTR